MEATGSEPLERLPIYDSGPENDPLYEFKLLWDNLTFRMSTLTWVSLISLLILYPGISVGFNEDPTAMLKSLNQGTLMFLLVATIVMQWTIFLLLYVTVFREETGLKGLGFKRIRGLDFAWAFAFLLAANLLLSGLAWFLAQIGLPMPGEIQMLIPTTPEGKVVWVLVSLTAGICEETAFRGYLMTRLRLTFGIEGWAWPVIISAIVFGACHAYQGWPGFIVITVYGVLFSLLYIRTGSIWPGIIAHFFQDFMALFIPQ